MTSIILNTATRILTPVLLLFSLFLVLVGHNEPGGGFAGGLVAASAIALILIARGAPAARQALRVSPTALLGSGLLLAVGSGLVRTLAGDPFLTGWWIVPGFGTPLLFDVGVYLVVVGASAMILFEMDGD